MFLYVGMVVDYLNQNYLCRNERIIEWNIWEEDCFIIYVCKEHVQMEVIGF